MSHPTLADTVAAEVRRICDGAPIDVVVKDGVVTLTGVVRDEAWRRRIEQDVLQLPGVLDVKNQLHVPLPAGEPAAQLRELFQRAGVAADAIRTAVVDGVVTLTGSADGWFDRDAAERLAWMLPGVREVVNHVSLPPGATVPNGDDSEGSG